MVPPTPPRALRAGRSFDLKALLNINFHHLGLFGAVIQHGGVQAAARALCRSPATISGQLKDLETALGRPLFARRGQRLVPTRFGEEVWRHVSEWFSLGQRLADCLGAGDQEPPPLHVGIADGVPLLVSARLLAPAAGGPGRLVCTSGRHEDLLDALVHHRLDLILTDRPPGSDAPGAEIRRIEASAIAWCVPETAAAGFAGGLPEALHDAPVVLPTPGTAMRQSIDAWFAQHGIAPRIVAECEDSALVKALAARSAAAFPVPAVVADEVCRQYGARVLGSMPGRSERYLVVALKRRRLPAPAERLIDPGGEARA